MKFREYLLNEETFINYDEKDKYIKTLESKINAPYISVQVSTLGGKNRTSILMNVSLDKKEDWKSKIFQNSRYLQFHWMYDGILKLFSRSYTLPKMRQTKAKSAEEVAKKINDYIKKVG